MATVGWLLRARAPTGFEFVLLDGVGHLHEELRHLRQRQIDLLACTTGAMGAREEEECSGV